MNANAFREDELVTRKMKVNGEWQSRTFPVVGGRLRILHENNDHLGIQTEIIRLDNDFVVVKAAADNGKCAGLPLITYLHLAMDQLSFQKLTISVCTHIGAPFVIYSVSL